MEFLEIFVAATFRIGTPLLLAAMGELILERSGVINIGIEGVMLCGAFAGFLAGWASGHPLLGAAASMLAGAALAGLLGVMVLRLRADQIVVGMALNLVAFGLAGTAYLGLQNALKHVGKSTTLQAPQFAPVFLSQSMLTWLAIAIVPCVWWYLNKTERGLELRAVGENPAAAEAAGVSVTACRFKACLVAGLLGGLGGGFLVLSQAASFSERCTSGRGFVALAAVVLGRYSAWGTAGACLFFGAAFAARVHFQAAGVSINAELLEMFPYVLTLLALALAFLARRNTGAPAALARPYDAGSR